MYPMLIESKCSGERPACKACSDRDVLCEYTSAPGLTPAAALKRKYEDLQVETADEHDLLGFLRTASEADAIKVLAYLRSSDNIQATLQQARNIPHASNSWAALDLPPHASEDHSVSQLDLHSTLATIDNPSIYPELTDRNGRTPWALPVEQYVCRYIPLVVL